MSRCSFSLLRLCFATCEHSASVDVPPIPLTSIINKHYKEILDNVEGYINYCKTEKLKVDFNKIDKFINFIKEYVKTIYGFNLI